MLLGCSVGLYAGWAGAAVWVNAATLLPEQVADGTAVPGLLPAGAALTAAVVAWRVPSQPAYVLAASWALVGALVSTAGAGATVLAVVAAAGLAVVAGTAVTSVVRRPS